MTELHGPRILEVLSQIAAALVGFSALVGALRRAPDTRLHELHQIRLSTIVLLPVVALVFCLAPYALANLRVPEPLLWRLLSGALAFSIAAMLLHIVWLNWRAARGAGVDEPLHYTGSRSS